MIIFKEEEHIRSVIPLGDGRFVLVDSCITFDHGCETMVFRSDSNGNVLSGEDIDRCLYSCLAYMHIGHRDMCKRWRWKNGRRKRK